MRKIRTVSLGFALSFAALSVFGQTTTPGTETSTTNLPPVGLASTETMQVNVVNAGPVLTSSSATPIVCSGSIAFYDVNGSMIGSAQDFKVTGGETSSVKLPYASAVASGTARVVVRAAISVTMNIVPGLATTVPLFLPVCFLTSSLETYDTATGVTHAYYVSAGPQTIPVLRTGQFTTALSK